jgi:hypothetical protein
MSLPPEGSSPEGGHFGQAKRRSDYVPFQLLPFDEPTFENSAKPEIHANQNTTPPKPAYHPARRFASATIA